MRWFWVDRIIAFESGRRVVAIKNVSLAEEILDEHIDGFPFLPQSFVIEGLAAAGGLLLAEWTQFRENVVLAKITKASFYDVARPSDTLTYTITLEDLKPEGGVATGTCRIGERLQAEAELCFAYLDKSIFPGRIISAEGYAKIVRSIRLYEVGCDQAGQRLQFPLELLQAEAGPRRLADQSGTPV